MMIPLITAALLLWPPVRDLEVQPPRIAGKCQFGTIHQTGKTVLIEGPSWGAAGTISTRGLLSVTWVSLGSGRGAVGAYQLEGDELVGQWGWVDEGAIITPEGDVCGENLSRETLRLERGK